MTPILVALFSVFLTVSQPLSLEAQAGKSGIISEGQHFTVKAVTPVDVTDLLKKLNYDYFLQVETFFAEGRVSSHPDDLLGTTLDAIYREVETILGLEVPGFHGVIVICPDKAAVGEEFHKLYGMPFAERSFYILEGNTIFISYQDLTLGMLGHEVAHAVISGYFVVPPPTKVQEVLAGYVEYSLRKTIIH